MIDCTIILLHMKWYLLLYLRLQILNVETILIDMSFTVLHMSFSNDRTETLSGCQNISFTMTTGKQSITTIIWLPLQIKNHNCLVEAMLLIVLSSDPNMQAKRKSIQQDLDLENGYNILEKRNPKLKGAKYVRECYARNCLQLKKRQAQC